MTYALPDKNNKTKFKLIFANLSEKDILLREKFDELKKKYPDTFDVVYVVEKGDKNWKGARAFGGMHCPKLNSSHQARSVTLRRK